MLNALFVILLSGCNGDPPTATGNREVFTNLKQAQDAVVRTIAKTIPGEWERIVVSYEMAYQDGGFIHNSLGFYIVRNEDGSFVDRDLSFTSETTTAFVELNEASFRTNNEYWGACDLVLDSIGKYEMNFSFDPPKRINGILDDQSYYRFSKYLEEYAASRK
jgi:hypothetical protein